MQFHLEASGEPLPRLLSRWFSIGGTLSTLTRSAPFECLIDIEYQPCISVTRFQRGFRDMPDFSLNECIFIKVIQTLRKSTHKGQFTNLCLFNSRTVNPTTCIEDCVSEFTIASHKNFSNGN